MRARALLALLVAVAACDSRSSSTSTATGGVPATGGATDRGGATAAGGGGAAGATAAGGATGSGGISAGGGASSAGGTTVTGGVTGNGGAAASGGATATAGATGSGGRTGAGGTSVPRSDGGPGGRADGGFGGGSSGGAGGSGGIGGVGGAGGARADAGPDGGLDVRPDTSADGAPDGRADTMAADGRTTSDGAPCPHAGSVTYTLTQNPNASADERAAYPLMTAAMDKAVYYYNCYTDITKKITVTYNTSVQTVDGNINGSIRFGPNTSYMEYTRAMHEISHTVGVGTASNWQSLLATPDGGGTRVWSGSNATSQLRAITGVGTDVLYGDNQHFWPYGLNYASEVKSEADVIDHCLMVVALRKDMGNP